MQYFVGLDWAAREHAVCVVDGRGAVVAQFTVAHTAVGMADLAARLAKLAPAAELRIAIERPTGLVVTRSSRASSPSCPSTPMSSRRHGHGTRLRRARPTSVTRTCSPTCCAPTDIAFARSFRCPMRRRHCVVSSACATTWSASASRPPTSCAACSSSSGLVPRRSSPTSIRRSPSSSSTATRRRSRRPVSVRSAWLRSCPGTRTAVVAPPPSLLSACAPHPGASPASAKPRSRVSASTRWSPAPPARRATCDAQRRRRARRRRTPRREDRHPAVPRRAHLRRAAARRVRRRPRSLRVRHHLAAEGGAAPVTRESGKHRAVTFRWACNMHLRQALSTLADTTRHTNPGARSIYQRARDRGHKHAHAVRILARAWCRVIWTCWRQRTPDDPTKHRAARPFALRLVDPEAA
jgi:hypothetical protein